MRFQPMPILTLLSVICVVILIVLGNWQYERFETKMAAQGAPERVEAPAIESVTLLDLGDVRIQQVYGVIDGEPVWRRYAPAELDGATNWVLVLVGVTGGPTPKPIALNDVEPIQQAPMLRRDPVTYPRGLFANPDDPEKNLWYTFDGRNLADKYGFETVPAFILEPVELNIVSSDDPNRVRKTTNPYAYETPPDPLPAERHFGYAITWWGMAMALLGVYLALHHARGRLRFRSEN